MLGQHLDRRAGALDLGGTDEHAAERTAGQAGDVELRLEGLPLAPVAVAAHGRVEQTERTLVGAAVDDLGREHDQPGAGRERRQPVTELRSQRFAQLRRIEQLVHRRGLAAGQHDPVDTSEVLRPLDEDDVSVERAQRLRVLAERTLQAGPEHDSPTPSARRRAYGWRLPPPARPPGGLTTRVTSLGRPA